MTLAIRREAVLGWMSAMFVSLLMWAAIIEGVLHLF